MEILNVVVTSDDTGLDFMKSFTPDNVEQAEKLFVEKVVELTLGEGEDFTTVAADDIREDAAQFIDDGCYEFKDNEYGYCVWLRWTTI